MQSELENLSFMYTNPQDYAKVKRRVADLYKEHEKELLEVFFLNNIYHALILTELKKDSFYYPEVQLLHLRRREC